MSEWTSISLKESQKEQLKDDKPDDMSMGTYLVRLVENADPEAVDVDLEAVVRDAVQEMEITVEASDDEKTAELLVDRLTRRLQDFDDDVREAAYSGAKEAVEEVAR